MIDQLNWLALAAADLKHAAPGPYKAMLEKFADLTEKAKEDCIRSPVEAVQVTQGRAQQCAQLYELFAKADLTANRILDRRK